MKVVIRKYSAQLTLPALKEFARRKGYNELYWYDMYCTKIEEPTDYFDMRDFYPSHVDYGENTTWDKLRTTCLTPFTLYPLDNECKTRIDPDLIYVVENFESDEMSPGEFKIVEIPDDVDWYIDSDCGCEFVAERHRTWS